MFEQFEQVIHNYEQALLENVKLHCEVCRLQRENAMLHERLAGLIDPPEVLDQDMAKHCAMERPE